MKKILTSILVMALLCSTLSTYAFAATNNGDITVVPNAATVYAEVTMSIIGNTAYISLQCDSGNSATTYIQATSYIEKLVGGQYVKIPLENGQTQWTNTASGDFMSLSITQKILTGAGQYRVTTQYLIHNPSTGNQVKTATYTANYN